MPPQPQPERRRQVTSAIEGMSVAEVRRGLEQMRCKWRSREEEPFFVCDTIFNGMTMQDFGYRFVMGHHHKRHNKSHKVLAGGRSSTTGGGGGGSGSGSETSAVPGPTLSSPAPAPAPTPAPDQAPDQAPAPAPALTKWTQVTRASIKRSASNAGLTCNN
jgi:hypothetical protein